MFSSSHLEQDVRLPNQLLQLRPQPTNQNIVRCPLVPPASAARLSPCDHICDQQMITFVREKFSAPSPPPGRQQTTSSFSWRRIGELTLADYVTQNAAHTIFLCNRLETGFLYQSTRARLSSVWWATVCLTVHNRYAISRVMRELYSLCNKIYQTLKSCHK